MNRLISNTEFGNWQYIRDRWRKRSHIQHNYPLYEPGGFYDEIMLTPGVSDQPTWHPNYLGKEWQRYDDIFRSIFDFTIFWHLHDVEKVKKRVDTMIDLCFTNGITEKDPVPNRRSLEGKKIMIDGFYYSLEKWE
jgi:hypothetical protein